MLRSMVPNVWHAYIFNADITMDNKQNVFITFNDSSVRLTVMLEHGYLTFLITDWNRSQIKHAKRRELYNWAKSQSI